PIQIGQGRRRTVAFTARISHVGRRLLHAAPVHGREAAQHLLEFVGRQCVDPDAAVGKARENHAVPRDDPEELAQGLRQQDLSLDGHQAFHDPLVHVHSKSAEIVTRRIIAVIAKLPSASAQVAWCSTTFSIAGYDTGLKRSTSWASEPPDTKASATNVSFFNMAFSFGEWNCIGAGAAERTLRPRPVRRT